MIIKGASVFCEDGTFQVKDVFVEDHKIVATEAEVSDKTVVDAKGYKLIPGLVEYTAMVHAVMISVTAT